MVRVRYQIRCAVSSTYAEQRDLANTNWEIVTDCEGEGGSWKTLLPPATVNKLLNLGNLVTCRFVAIRTTSRDPTLPPVPIQINVNGPPESTATIVSATNPGGPSSGIVSIANTNGTLSLVTTSTPHGLQLGTSITISGDSNSIFNGNWVVVSVPNSTTFTFNQVIGSPPQSGTGGTVAAIVSGVTSYTTSAPHGFDAGQTVVVTGNTETDFNGTWVIASVPSPTVFTVFQNVSVPPETGTGGTAELVIQTVTIAPLGDSAEGHYVLSTTAITSIYATNPDPSTFMDVTVVGAGD
jgi:hypothetical protein